MLVRFASDIRPFDGQRRTLYKSVKVVDGQAEYYFEPVVLTDPDDPDGPGITAHLTLDEFIADVWNKGVRFGIDTESVQRAIQFGKTERVIVASLAGPAARGRRPYHRSLVRPAPQRRAAPAGQRQARSDGLPEPFSCRLRRASASSRRYRARMARPVSNCQARPCRRLSPRTLT
ncbi:hypothetical protein LP420_33935 [Massilia sp. B-10]|nr:hypothetical protein LP420_33935 [Massilia sp. B-10]